MKTFFKTAKHAGGWAGAFLLSLSVFITYCCGRTLVWENQTGNLVAYGYQIWGDWAAHFTFISQFRERGLGWVFKDNPLFQGVPFQYPFLSHLFTQAFASIGAALGFWSTLDVASPTYVLSLTLIFLLPFVLYFGIRSLGLQSRTSVLTVVIFLFAGGIQFLDSNVDPHFPLTNQVGGPYFTNFLMFEFLPQRAFLFGLLIFAGLGGILLRNPTPSRVAFGILFLPFLLWMHVHTWIALAILLLCLFVLHPKRKAKKAIFIFGAVIAVLSAVLMKVYLFRASIPEIYRQQWPLWAPGWFPEQSNLLVFWVYQTGVFLPLAAYGFFLNYKNYFLRPFFAAGVICFLIGFFIRMQPSAYDNLKIITYAWFFLAPFVALALESFLKTKLKMPIAVLLLLCLTASGLNDTIFFARRQQNATLFYKSEMELAEEWLNIRRSAEDRVLLVPRHNHWVTCLAGSPVWIGYQGWLWTWGVNYGPREKELVSIITGEAGSKEKILEQDLKYAVFNEADQIAGKRVNFEFFKTNYKLIFSKSGWSAFDLREPTTSVR